MQRVLETKKQELKKMLIEKVEDDLSEIVDSIVDYNSLSNIIISTKKMSSKKKKDYIDIIEFFLEGQPKPDNLNKK